MITIDKNRYHHHFTVVAVRTGDGPYDFSYYLDDGSLIFGKDNVWDSKVPPNGDPCGEFIHPRDKEDVSADDIKMFTHITHLLGAFQKDETTND
jgi:hypothetical protein